MNTRPVSSKHIGLGLAALLVSAACAQAQTYTAIDLGTFPGGSFISAWGINNAGQVVGEAAVASGYAHAFLYSGGTLVDLGALPGGSQSSARAINDYGQIVGASQIASGSLHAFLYDGGTMIDLGTLPGGSSSYALSINGSGQIVGLADTTTGGAYHAFRSSGGRMTDLGTLPGGINCHAFGINDSGQVVGYAAIAAGMAEHAFMSSGGSMIDLGTLPGASHSYARAINNGGRVVGMATVSGSRSHAFVYSGGTMTDLGTLPGADALSDGYDINNGGQVVGFAQVASGAYHAFLYNGGSMMDLNDQVSLPSGVVLSQATAINDIGQIVANGNDNHAYLLNPRNSPLTALNPFAPYASRRMAPPTLGRMAVLYSPPATSLAADGRSAVVLAYQSDSFQPVTFTLSAIGIGLSPGTVVGSLGQFDPNYLASPNPPGGNLRDYQVTTPTYGPDAGGNYTFLVLLWGPNAMPAPNAAPVIDLAVTATQQGRTETRQAFIALEPPPLLLVHGIWSNAAGTGFSSGSNGFYDWISRRYPHNLVSSVDYGVKIGATNLNTQAFSDPRIQDILLSNVADVLARAAGVGMAARSVDVVAHSMGGLVTRYFLSSPGLLPPKPLPNPVHQLITIGTPHLGSNLARALDTNQGQLLASAFLNPVVLVWCSLGDCTLGGVMAALGKQVGPGSQSLEPGSSPIQALSPAHVFRAIVGNATVSPQSKSEGLLNVLIGAFLPGQTVASILNHEDNDTIVPVSSQNPPLPGVADVATVMGIVHASLSAGDTGETQSPAVWAQAYYWLIGGAGTAPAASPTAVSPRPLASTSTAPPPVLDLNGYTQVGASNVTLLPAAGSTLTINTATNITATSSTKIITELLLLQTVTDPTDAPFLYSTQYPFTISFTPTRLGSASFGAIAVFSDNTYAMTTLNYTFQASGVPYALNLVNAPVASMTEGDSRVIEADAFFTNGPVDVTQAATYSARSGSASVISVSSGGTITANGNGVDLLDVSYGGVTATAEIPVGWCTYDLNPTNQIVPSTGGTVTIHVTTQSGCAWTASGGAAWLPFTQASGSGYGTITLTAEANSSGGIQAAFVTLAGLQAMVAQPTTACSYGLSQTQINAHAPGASGTITAATSCPVIVSSNQHWVTATPLGVVRDVHRRTQRRHVTAKRDADRRVSGHTCYADRASLAQRRDGACWRLLAGATCRDLHGDGLQPGLGGPRQRFGDGDRDRTFRVDVGIDERNGLELFLQRMHAWRLTRSGLQLPGDLGEGRCRPQRAIFRDEPCDSLRRELDECKCHRPRLRLAILL